MNEKTTDAMPVITEPEELLDARMWERADETSLFEACVALINAGIKGEDGRVLIHNEHEIVVTSWTPGGGDWRDAVRRVQRAAKVAKQSRQLRKSMQAEILNAAAAEFSSKTTP